MNFIREPALPAGRRVSMAHCIIQLADGHNVGITLAGGRVPDVPVTAAAGHIRGATDGVGQVAIGITDHRVLPP
jgi:hypothetical protein